MFTTGGLQSIEAKNEVTRTREYEGSIAKWFPGQHRRVLTLLSIWLGGWFKAAMLRAMAATWRKDTVGLEALDRRLSENRGCVVVFWHGKYLALCALLQKRRACVFSSYSHRGSLLADVCRRFGYVPVQIPDEHLDNKLDFMKGTLGHFTAAAIAVDGPVGPYHLVKRGAVRLASELGYAIVPVSFAARRAHVLAQRWDRMEVPKLFSRVCLVVGKPIELPPHLSEAAVHDWSEKLHDVLEEIDARASRHVQL